MERGSSIPLFCATGHILLTFLAASSFQCAATLPARQRKIHPLATTNPVFFWLSQCSHPKFSQSRQPLRRRLSKILRNFTEIGLDNENSWRRWLYCQKNTIPSGRKEVSIWVKNTRYTRLPSHSLCAQPHKGGQKRKFSWGMAQAVSLM